MARTTPPEDGSDLADLFDELEELRGVVDTAHERNQVDETMDVAAELSRPHVARRVIWGFDRGDVAESVLGAAVFGIPMFVEEGTIEIGSFLATQPVALLATVGAAIGIVHGILYVSEFRDVRIRDRLLGVIPRRMAGVLGVAMVSAIVAMTVWGRVEWVEPWLAICRCTVAFVPMAIGAALGDIIPGT